MKKVLALALGGIMTVGILAGCAPTNNGGSTTPAASGSTPPALAANPIIYKISGGLPDSHFETLALKELETYVETATNGEIDVQIFSNNQLGDDNEAIQLIQQGVVQMCPSGTSVLSNYEKSFNLLSSPYLFKDMEQVAEVLNGDWGQALLDSLQGSGLKGLGMGLLGMTNISNSQRPIVTAEDLVGLKLRCPPNPALVSFYEAVGASPISMSFNELFSALQQGVVHGQLNPFTTIYSNNFQEVQSYISKTSDIASLVCFVVNEAEFAKLTPEQQTAIQEGVDIAVAYMASSCAEEEAKSEADLLATGKVKINEVSDETKAALLQKGFSVIERYGKESNEELWNALKVELDLA